MSLPAPSRALVTQRDSAWARLVGRSSRCAFGQGLLLSGLVWGRSAKGSWAIALAPPKLHKSPIPWAWQRWAGHACSHGMSLRLRAEQAGYLPGGG